MTSKSQEISSANSSRIAAEACWWSTGRDGRGNWLTLTPVSLLLRRPESSGLGPCWLVDQMIIRFSSYWSVTFNVNAKNFLAWLIFSYLLDFSTKQGKLLLYLIKSYELTRLHNKKKVILTKLVIYLTSLQSRVNLTVQYLIKSYELTCLHNRRKKWY